MFFDDDDPPGDPAFCSKHPDHKKCEPTPVTVTDFWSKGGCLPAIIGILLALAFVVSGVTQ